MTQIAGNAHPAAAGWISTAGARSRALMAAISVALIFALGAGTGMALGPALRGATQAASVGNDTAVAQAYQIWLQGETGSYASVTAQQRFVKGDTDSYSSSSSPAQAHQIWLQGELGSYGSGATPASVSGPLK